MDPVFKGGQEYRLKGRPICPGIAIGKPFIFIVVEDEVPEFTVAEEEIDHEIARYHRALNASRQDIASLKKNLQKEEESEAAAILNSHLEMMGDPLLTKQIVEGIREQGKNTEYVFKTFIKEYKKKFSKITDLFFQERLKDFQDISRRIICNLHRQERSCLSKIGFHSIVFAHELSLSDTVEANTDYIEAFVTRSGSETSHVAIMARAKGIPFVSNVDFPDLKDYPSIQIVVDGISGKVILNPSEETLSYFVKKKQKIQAHVEGLQKSEDIEPQTADGYKIRLSVNIGLGDEVESLEGFGEGVGLFRTENLFLARDAFPSEEEQFQVYRNVLRKVNGNFSVIRTFDIGGDKLGNFYPSRYERNPYLGCRAIRLMLKEKATFKMQIRALLRASAFGEVGILFPMISGISELRQAKGIIEEAKRELRIAGIAFSQKMRIGCMIEVPSAVMICDLLAKECDFLSIGTNDLVQYSLAVDRGNPSMSYLYAPAHPSIIRMIKMVVEEGNKAHVPISLCGEIAADPHFTPLLLGLGIHELSVSAFALPTIKDVVRRLKVTQALKLANHVISLSTPEEVEHVLAETYLNLVKDI